MSELWGDHPEFGLPDSIAELCGYRMLTSFYDSGFRDVENRRELLYHNLMGVGYDTSEVGVLAPNRARLPVATFLPKVVRTLATAYSTPPVRTWENPDSGQIIITANADTGGDGAATETPETIRLREICAADGIDGRLQDALRYAKLCSGCVVGAYIGARGRTQVQILTPDLCRWKADPLFPDHLTELWLPMIRRTDANGEPLADGPVTVYQVWTDSEVKYVDASGDPDSEDAFYFEPPERDEDGNLPEGIEDGDLEPIKSRPNPYGRIPFVVMRLAEPNSYDTFSGGLLWLAEECIRANATQWNAEMSEHYDSHGHWVTINMKLDGTVPRFGVGGYSSVEGADAGDMLPPSITNIPAGGQYTNLSEQRRNQIKDALRLAELPESEIVEQSGNPPSGVSRILERMPLIELRRQDIETLRFFEQEFWDMLIRVRNVDTAGFEEPLPEGLKVSVTFADESMILEPKDEVELAKARFDAGLISASQYVKDAGGQTFTDDREAARFIIENQKVRKSIEAGIVPGEEPGGGTAADGTTDTGGTDSGGTDAGAAANELRTSVGGSAQIAERQAEFYEGKVPRSAVVANLVHVLGFTQREAEALLPQEKPTPLAAIAEQEAIIETEQPEPTTQ